ncbi:MAG TPA: hypothetical protein DCS43_11320, partial [Verrucomicrobia bacterium]|nr:hypothetical protein [Verrucomicrobiota bacterium]
SNREWTSVASSSDGSKLVAVVTGNAIYTSSGGIDLTFTPAADAYGAPYSSFTFQVQDDGGTANSGVDLDPTPKTMTINVTEVPDDQAITFPAIGDKVTTDAVGLAATASSGLPVSFAVGAGPATIAVLTNLTFTGTGAVSIVASQAGNGSWNPVPDVTNTFNVTKAAAQVFLSDLAQTYDGTARTVTATSMPAGLTIELTYDGNAWAPTNVGSYAVTGTVNEAMYQGMSTGTLVVGKADQTITFGPIVPQKQSALVGLAAAASSGLGVTFTADPPGSISGGTNLTFIGVGDVRVVASQTGNGTYSPAPSVTNVIKVFSVTPDSGPYAGGNTVTVTNGYFGSITNVLVGSTGVSPVSSGDNWFTITLPAGVSAGFVDFIVQTSNNGDTTLVDAYVYNPAGEIGENAVTAILDNTLNGTASLTNSLGSLTLNNWNARVISTPEGEPTPLAGMKMSLYSMTTPGTNTVDLSLYYVDASYNPVGSALVSTNVVLNLTTTAAYYDIPLNTEQWILQPATNYALVFKGSTPGITMSWTVAGPGSGNSYVTTNGFIFLSNRRTTNGGSSWSVNSFYNGLQLLGSTLNSGVTPASGSWTGGYPVVISGMNLCNGSLSDATNVTLCGVSVAVIDIAGSTQIVVTAGQAASAGMGDVVVYSTSYGATTKSNAFTYIAPGLQVLGTNGAVIASDDSAQVANGTKFSPLLPYTSWTNTFSITNNGTETLTISGFGHVNPDFEIAGIPTSVGVGGVSNFTVKFAPTSVGTYNDWLTISNDSPTAAYVVRLYGPCFGVSTNAGPFGGGNTITIANGYFGIITNVLVDGMAATLVESSGSSFTIVMPPATNAGLVDITVQTSDNGDITLANAYTYNPAGAIGGTSLGPFVWTNMASRFNNQVRSLAYDGTNLYAGGDFTSVGGSPTRLGIWRGTNWVAVGSGVNGNVYTLAHDGTNLYVGGLFSSPSMYRASWSGTAWSALGAGVSQLPLCLAYNAGYLFMGLYSTNGVFAWNGTTWTNLGGVMSSNVNAVAHDGVSLYAGGAFTVAGGVAANYVATWNGTTWSGLGSGMNGAVNALLHDGTHLYAGGAFTSAGGAAANYVAMWNGTTWTNLGLGMTGSVNAFAYDGTNLYAGGAFTNAGGATAKYVAMWDGTNWTGLGSGMNAAVNALVHDGSKLVAGGLFTTADGLAASNVAMGAR